MSGRKLAGVTERLNEAIYRSGLMPHEIMAAAKIGHSQYYNHINGASLNELNIAKYCRVLHISADWLLGLDKEVTP
jgi:hypothetical protein